MSSEGQESSAELPSPSPATQGFHGNRRPESRKTTSRCSPSLSPLLSPQGTFSYFLEMDHTPISPSSSSSSSQLRTLRPDSVDILTWQVPQAPAVPSSSPWSTTLFSGASCLSAWFCPPPNSASQTWHALSTAHSPPICVISPLKTSLCPMPCLCPMDEICPMDDHPGSRPSSHPLQSILQHNQWIFKRLILLISFNGFSLLPR